MRKELRSPICVQDTLWAGIGSVLAVSLLTLLVVPLAVLALGASFGFGSVLEQLSHPMVLSALWLSLRTTFISLGLIIIGGLPLAWFLARAQSSRFIGIVETLVELPIIVPPAVVGVALLLTFGRYGIFGEYLERWFEIRLTFTTTAVVIAQVVVSAPFFVQSAIESFRRIDDELLVVARSLGASSSRTFFRIAVPLAMPGLASGAALSWARALGEFGATLVFAGNLPGRTQTMTLAVYSGLEVSIELARALSVILMITGVALLVVLRTLLGRATMGGRD